MMDKGEIVRYIQGRRGICVAFLHDAEEHLPHQVGAWKARIRELDLLLEEIENF